MCDPSGDDGLRASCYNVQSQPRMDNDPCPQSSAGGLREPGIELLRPSKQHSRDSEVMTTTSSIETKLVKTGSAKDFSQFRRVVFAQVESASVVIKVSRDIMRPIGTIRRNADVDALRRQDAANLSHLRRHILWMKMLYQLIREHDVDRAVLQRKGRSVGQIDLKILMGGIEVENLR